MAKKTDVQVPYDVLHYEGKKLLLYKEITGVGLEHQKDGECRGPEERLVRNVAHQEEDETWGDDDWVAWDNAEERSEGPVLLEKQLNSEDTTWTPNPEQIKALVEHAPWMGGESAPSWGEDASDGVVHAFANGILGYIKRDVSTREFILAANNAYKKMAWYIAVVCFLLCVLPAFVIILASPHTAERGLLGELFAVAIMFLFNFLSFSYVVALVWILPRDFLSFRFGHAPKQEAKKPLFISVAYLSLLIPLSFLSAGWRWAFVPLLLLCTGYHFVRGVGIWLVQDRLFQSPLYFHCFGLYMLFLFPVVMPFVVIKAMN